jgi:hypothetical protein
MTTTSQPYTPTAGRSARRQARALIEVTLFVAVWMLVGWPFGGSAVAYLLLGVPLTVAFQLGVRRRPLVELWVRDVSGFQLGAVGRAVTAALLIAPAVQLVRDVVSGSRPTPPSWPPPWSGQSASATQCTMCVGRRCPQCCVGLPSRSRPG